MHVNAAHDIKRPTGSIFIDANGQSLEAPSIIQSAHGHTPISFFNSTPILRQRHQQAATNDDSKHHAPQPTHHTGFVIYLHHNLARNRLALSSSLRARRRQGFQSKISSFLRTPDPCFPSCSLSTFFLNFMTRLIFDNLDFVRVTTCLVSALPVFGAPTGGSPSCGATCSS